jgi:hypothetical protein
MGGSASSLAFTQEPLSERGECRGAGLSPSSNQRAANSKQWFHCKAVACSMTLPKARDPRPRHRDLHNIGPTQPALPHPSIQNLRLGLSSTSTHTHTNNFSTALLLLHIHTQPTCPTDLLPTSNTNLSNPSPSTPPPQSSKWLHLPAAARAAKPASGKYSSRTSLHDNS